MWCCSDLAVYGGMIMLAAGYESARKPLAHSSACRYRSDVVHAESRALGPALHYMPI